MNTKLQYRIGFATPAFLGDADGQGTWRVPPFKALLRQWWRVVHAPVVKYDVSLLRADEDRIFGAAAEKKAHRSLVQVRLGHWNVGGLTANSWPKDIGSINAGSNTLAADLYLGYGPILTKSRRRAINPGEANTLDILLDRRLEDRDREEITTAIRLMDWFGTMGSRSRNGWGSLIVRPDASSPGFPDVAGDLARFTRPLEDCFRFDWAHAIGRDEAGPLVWVGKRDGMPFPDWRQAIRFMAEVRRAARRVATLAGRGKSISATQLFAFPVANQPPSQWKPTDRLPNSLRLKLLEVDGGFHPVVYHMPTDLPAALMNALSPPDRTWVRDNRVAMWKSVHEAVAKLMAPRGARA
jgi:CRISPR-associated protein Cmr1